MSPSFAPAIVSLLAAAGLLAACGGDGDEGHIAAQPAAATVEPGTCMPGREAFDALAVNQTLAEVQQRIGCPGRRVPTVESGDVNSYEWQDPKDETHRLRLDFSIDRLFRKRGWKIGYPPGSSPCLPSAAVFETLPTSVSYKTTVQHVGCEGRRLHEDITSEYARVEYLWGNSDQVGPRALVTFVNDKSINASAWQLAP